MRVLIADDDAVARRVMERQLTTWGYSVVAASDREAAWRILSGPDAPGIALLDWEMLGLDGQELCSRVRAMRPERYTFLFLLTRRDNTADLVSGLEAGADDYLRKPCDPAELAARLRVGQRNVMLYQELRAAREALRTLAHQDGLTGVLNRRGVLEVLDAEVAAMERRSAPLALAMLDLDHFKRVNDTWGHPAGDEVLCETARRIRRVIRPYDRVGRLGGEEFLVVLPGCPPRALDDVAERIRSAVAEEHYAVEGRQLRVTCSIGVALVPTAREAVATLRCVDEALYRAKNGGRNRVVRHAPDVRRQTTTADARLG